MSEDPYDYAIPLTANKHRQQQTSAYADLLYKIVANLLNKGSILPIQQMAKELFMGIDELRGMLTSLQEDNPQFLVTLDIAFDHEEVVLQVTKVSCDSYEFDIPAPFHATLTYNASVWPALKNYGKT